MTENMKTRSNVTKTMLPMVFTATMTHWTTCLRPLAPKFSSNFGAKKPRCDLTEKLPDFCQARSFCKRTLPLVER